MPKLREAVKESPVWRQRRWCGLKRGNGCGSDRWQRNGGWRSGARGAACCGLWDASAGWRALTVEPSTELRRSKVKQPVKLHLHDSTCRSFCRAPSSLFKFTAAWCSTLNQSHPRSLLAGMSFLSCVLSFLCLALALNASTALDVPLSRAPSALKSSSLLNSEAVQCQTASAPTSTT